METNLHRADIVALLRKRGLSLTELSKANGLHPRTLNNALDRKYPKAEKIIASALGLEPAEIWPERYKN